MSEYTLIKHIDLGVHFDYMRCATIDHPQSPESADRFARVDERIKTVIAPDPQSVMFYFSDYHSILDNRLVRASKVLNEEAYIQEVGRIESYKELLGDRFFLFGGWEKPDPQELSNLLALKGFTHDYKSTTLCAYGEWLQMCVEGWKNHIKKVMMLKSKNVNSLPELSLKYDPKQEYELFRITMSSFKERVSGSGILSPISKEN